MTKPISLAMAIPRFAKNAAMIARVLPPAMGRCCQTLRGRCLSGQPGRAARLPRARAIHRGEMARRSSRAKGESRRHRPDRISPATPRRANPVPTRAAAGQVIHVSTPAALIPMTIPAAVRAPAARASCALVGDGIHGGVIRAMRSRPDAAGQWPPRTQVQWSPARPSRTTAVMAPTVVPTSPVCPTTAVGAAWEPVEVRPTGQPASGS